MRALYEVQLSENFTGWEFRCKGEEEKKPCCCHGAVSVDRRLISVLQACRSYIDSPLHVNSAFRCDDYNEAVDGHPRSFHRVGMAADITSIQIRKALEEYGEAFAEILEDVAGEGIGNVIIYEKKRFLHLDVGHRIGDDLVRFK